MPCPSMPHPLLMALLESPRLHGKITSGQRSLVREMATVVGSRREFTEIARGARRDSQFWRLSIGRGG